MIADSGLHLVKAIHNFKGSNNDELCFKKGDIITVTQNLDGGWWEGTLNELTGWFPSNYVKDLKQDSLKPSKSIVWPSEAPLSPKLESMKMYRGIVFKDIIDTESNHLNEIQTLVNNFLHPLQETDILSDRDYKLLASNIEDVCSCNKIFLTALEDVKEKPSKEQKIGGVFIQMAPQIKKANIIYCSNHPKAALVIEEHKDAISKFMEEHGANIPGILTLTTGLSRPFRRLEKYPALLQELQRHTEENHIDRGDTQRAISVYKDIAASCLKIRRQKEMELEVMAGNIKGWEGEDIHGLGEICHMGSVVFLTEDQEKKDRYLVVFPHNLVVLSVSPRMSTFIYEGKLPLSGVVISKLDSIESRRYSFEITGNMIQRIIVICPTQESLDQWLSVLHQYIRNNQLSSNSPNVVVSKDSAQSSPSHASQSHSSISPTSSIQQPLLPPHFVLSSPIQLDEKPAQATTNSRVISSLSQKGKIWSSWCLKPHPPMKPNLTKHHVKGDVMLRRNNSRKKEKVPEEKNYEGDMRILQVIEAYCTSAKTRYTVNSSLIDTPQILIAEEEKIIIEELQGNTTITEEKTLVDTVYALKDQVQGLKSETTLLFKNLEEERKARKRLEYLLKQHVFSGCEDILTSYLE